jgi:hypothetical protein
MRESRVKRMRRFVPILFLAVAAGGLLVPAALHAERYLARSMQVQVLVANPERTADLLAEWSEDHGGYYTFKSTEMLVLRIPMDQLESLRVLTEQEAEQLVSIGFDAQDLREGIVSARSGIQSREEILERNLRYLDRADVEGTLAIEREITRLLQEIEALKGRLTRLVHDTRYARAEIQIRFMEQTLPHDIPSSFQWINSVDFYTFVQGGFTP